MNNIEENIKVLEKLQEDQDKRLVSEEEKFETHSKLDLLYARKASMLRQKNQGSNGQLREIKIPDFFTIVSKKKSNE